MTFHRILIRVKIYDLVGPCGVFLAFKGAAALLASGMADRD